MPRARATCSRRLEPGPKARRGSLPPSPPERCELPTPSLTRRLCRHGENELCHPFRLVHLHEVPGGGQQKEIRRGKELVKALRDPPVQVRIRGPEDDPHRRAELA